MRIKTQLNCKKPFLGIKMIDRLLRKCGMELHRVKHNGKIEEYRLRLQQHDRIELTVIDASINGQQIRFAVNFREDHIQRHHFRGEFYEQKELERIGQYFKGGTLIDIGANVGNHSIYAAKFLNAKKVIAFEPGDLASTIFKCNISLNDLQNVIEVRKVALSDAAGMGTFESPMPYNLGAARVLIDKAGSTPVMTGDVALQGEAVEFIKIDTEGLELRVLFGLEGIISSQRPGLFVEVEDKNTDAVNSFLLRVGYEVVERVKNYEGMANWIAIASN